MSSFAREKYYYNFIYILQPTNQKQGIGIYLNYILYILFLINPMHFNKIDPLTFHAVFFSHECSQNPITT